MIYFTDSVNHHADKFAHCNALQLCKGGGKGGVGGQLLFAKQGENRAAIFHFFVLQRKKESRYSIPRKETHGGFEVRSDETSKPPPHNGKMGLSVTSVATQAFMCIKLYRKS